MTQVRIGHGFDLHALATGETLVLGGVAIEHDKGLVGHSDADVLIHALCDACLGAAGLGDIGVHFPDTEAKYKGIDSRELLRAVAQLLADKGWQVGNADVTVIAQAPKLRPFITAMEANLAADLGVAVDGVNIKATTTERLGVIGREEAITAEAVVLLIARPGS